MIKTIKKNLWSIGIILLAVAYVLVSRDSAPPPKQIIPVTLPQVNSAEPKNLVIAARPGHPMVVNFFASWCNVCDAEPPYLKQLKVKLDETQGEVIGIATHDSKAALLRGSKLSERPFPIGLDRHGDYAQKLNISGVPQTILVDADGQLLYHVRGQLSRYHVTKISNKIDLALRKENHDRAPPLH